MLWVCLVRSLTTLCRELKTTAQLAGLIPTDDPDMSTRTLQFFEEFYAEYGMPNESEKEILSLFGRVSIPDLERWCMSDEALI